jgi:hypothetical protein
MCTAFVYKGNDVITAFNFDQAPEVEVKVKSNEQLVYGVFNFKGRWSVPFGVNKDGGFGCELMCPPSQKADNLANLNIQRIDLLTEDYINDKISFEQAGDIVKARTLVNAPGISLHSLFTNRFGQALILEPGRGNKIREERYTVLTNFSFFEPMTTKQAPYSGYDRYVTATSLLEKAGDAFNATDALAVLKQCLNPVWPTKVSMVYSAHENKVYWVLDGHFDKVYIHQF